MNPDRYSNTENKEYLSGYFQETQEEFKIDCGTGGTQSIKEKQKSPTKILGNYHLKMINKAF